MQLHRAGAAILMALKFTPNAKINLGSSRLAADVTVGCFKNLVSTAHHPQYLTPTHKLRHESQVTSIWCPIKPGPGELF